MIMTILRCGNLNIVEIAKTIFKNERWVASDLNINSTRNYPVQARELTLYT